jgi:hypothetical protein
MIRLLQSCTVARTLPDASPAGEPVVIRVRMTMDERLLIFSSAPENKTPGDDAAARQRSLAVV